MPVVLFHLQIATYIRKHNLSIQLSPKRSVVASVYRLSEVRGKDKFYNACGGLYTLFRNAVHKESDLVPGFRQVSYVLYSRVMDRSTRRDGRLTSNKPTRS